MKLMEKGFSSMSYGLLGLLCIILCSVRMTNEVSIKDDPYKEGKSARRVQPGRYDHVAHGGLRGKYVHDNRGTYIHIHIPYDGGYGDRGLPYIHDTKGHVFRPTNSRSLSPLGPDDHIHFSLDFNYNGTGWQIIKFHWIRDGADDHNYNYESATRLWEVIDENDEEYAKYEMGSGEPDNDDNYSTDYAENGGYQYGIKNANKNNDNLDEANNLQRAFIEILQYLAKNVIPNV